MAEEEQRQQQEQEQPPRPESAGEKERKHREEMSRRVGEKEERKIRAREEKQKPLWSWIGTFGLVGWSVAIPTLIGVFLGMWLDANVQSQYSWTLTLLVVGVLAGCLNAWYWVKRESRKE